MSKAKVMFPSDTISLKDVYTGGNSAGNGGDGVNTGDISSKPSIEFNPYNKAEGADVHVNTGDKVHQDADWDAGGANAKAEKHSKEEGGNAYSNGDQESESGHNKSDVDANTSAYQKNDLKVDMSQNVWAGIGGEGGDHNKAEGGDVDVKASIESATDSFNSHEYYQIDDSGMIAHG
jgi:cytoskeletal protein RodZ